MALLSDLHRLKSRAGATPSAVLNEEPLDRKDWSNNFFIEGSATWKMSVDKFAETGDKSLTRGPLANVGL